MLRGSIPGSVGRADERWQAASRAERWSRGRWSLVVLALVFSVALVGCQGAPPAEGSGSDSSKAAVRTAVDHIRTSAGPEFDLSEHMILLREHEDTWEVSFPRRSPDSAGRYTLGGEPHVLISRATGEIVDVFDTE